MCIHIVYYSKITTKINSQFCAFINFQCFYWTAGWGVLLIRHFINKKIQIKLKVDFRINGQYNLFRSHFSVSAVSATSEAAYTINTDSCSTLVADQVYFAWFFGPFYFTWLFVPFEYHVISQIISFLQSFWWLVCKLELIMVCHILDLRAPD